MAGSPALKAPGGARLRILHLEDNSSDRELVCDSLREGGLDCDLVYAASEQEFRAALENVDFDVILSDFTLPSFSGSAGLRIARELRPEIPFIYVSGTIGEERAVHSLKSGATDYVLKGHLTRLAEVVRRALREATERLDRGHAEQALRQSEQRFRELAETIEDVFWIKDVPRSRILYVSPAYDQIWGRVRQSLYDDPRSWIDAIHPDDRERVLHAAMTRQNLGAYDEEYRIIRPDGQVRWIRDRAYPVHDDAGQTERVVGVARDITERRELEAQLRQAQKMEAIGQIAGGVAHDFNNILGVIMIQAELAEVTERSPEEIRSDLREIRAAAERAATLTRQLLLFSRRQAMEPKDLDLNESVSSLAKMLRRFIGADIELELSLHDAPLLARADPGMVDQVILNLAVNARDAMPRGGRLRIETGQTVADDALAGRHAEIVPGRYVRLIVSDSGAGIPPEVMPRIFEPFFTTKAPGKGTGLGLATVFGIVKQHRGWIDVESPPGRGASFHVFLPASSARGSAAAAAADTSADLRGSETILLVEDEATARLVTRALLERFGYRVLEAADGEEATRIWAERQNEIALVLTDMIMPGPLTGAELAEQFKREKPGLGVILATGFSSELTGASSALRSGGNFLQKPFRPNQLLHLLRRLLDENTGGRQ